MPTDTTIIDRLRHYVAERRNMRGLDPDVVHAVHSPLDEPRHAELRLSDLSALLDALTAAHAARDAAEERASLNERMALYATLETRKAGERLTAALRERDEARAALATHQAGRPTA